ncbi:ABC transporter C family member 8 [Glycine soja]|uniref:ABC transporter C family member 8 n=1 Tax=Glycine soja TaxID=3848 RepID=A0A445JYB9_GLYSO|nr:ABC transporter C family member 8 [Glycine soja]
MIIIKTSKSFASTRAAETLVPIVLPVSLTVFSGRGWPELGHTTILSKLTFSWVNSLLRLGYSKPLALEDIPSLLSEDEAKFSYQNFMHTWESLVRERSKDNTKNLVL